MPQKQRVGASIEMSGGINDPFNHSNHARMMQTSGRSLGVVSVAGGQSIASTASTLYGGGVTITGGPPDEIFKDEYGNECTRYSNRTIIVNEHMANAAETRNHNGMDIDGGYSQKFGGASFRNRAIAFVFVAATIVLLLVVLLDVGVDKSVDRTASKSDKLAAAMGFNNDDLFEDDDDNINWDQMTASALGDD